MSHRGKGKKKIVTCPGDKKDDYPISVSASNLNAPLKTQTLADNNELLQKANAVNPDWKGCFNEDTLGRIPMSFRLNSGSNSPLQSSMTMDVNKNLAKQEEVNIKLNYLEQIESLKHQLKMELDTNELLEKKHTIGMTTKVKEHNFSIKNRIEDLEQQVHDLKLQQTQLQDRLEVQDQASQLEISKLQSQLEANIVYIGILKETEQTLRQSESELKAKNLELQSSFDRNSHLLDLSIQNCNDLSIKVETAESEIENLKKALHNKEKEIVFIKNPTQDLKEEPGKSFSQHDSSIIQTVKQNQVVKQDGLIASLQQELSKTQEIFKGIQTQLQQQSQDEKKELLSRVEQQEREIEGLKNDSVLCNRQNRLLFESNTQLQRDLLKQNHQSQATIQQLQAQMRELVGQKERQLSEKEDQWKVENLKLRQFIESEVRAVEQEREINRRIFSYDGQQTFDKQRKEIATLQQALISRENEVKDLKELIQKMTTVSTEQKFKEVS